MWESLWGLYYKMITKPVRNRSVQQRIVIDNVTNLRQRTRGWYEGYWGNSSFDVEVPGTVPERIE